MAVTAIAMHDMELLIIIFVRGVVEGQETVAADVNLVRAGIK